MTFLIQVFVHRVPHKWSMLNFAMSSLKSSSTSKVVLDLATLRIYEGAGLRLFYPVSAHTKNNCLSLLGTPEWPDFDAMGAPLGYEKAQSLATPIDSAFSGRQGSRNEMNGHASKDQGRARKTSWRRRIARRNATISQMYVRSVHILKSIIAQID